MLIFDTNNDFEGFTKDRLINIVHLKIYIGKVYE